MVKLTGLLNWHELTTIAITIRDSKKAVCGLRWQPRCRGLLGVAALMAAMNMTIWDAEDLIAHYATAPYRCNLMDSDVRLYHVTIFEFITMLGDAGVAQINQNILSTVYNGPRKLDSLIREFPPYINRAHIGGFRDDPKEAAYSPAQG